LEIFHRSSKRDGPDAYFDFNGGIDGKEAGIGLPVPIEKWPFANGYTFLTWMRVESFIDPTGRPGYRPSLFSFTTDDEIGIEIFFINNILSISSCAAKGISALSSWPHHLPLNRKETSAEIFLCFRGKEMVLHCYYT
jgi:hypothetical protein